MVSGSSIALIIDTGTVIFSIGYPVFISGFDTNISKIAPFERGPKGKIVVITSAMSAHP